MQAFSEVMLTGSVSEAARNLHRSQSAVSALISGLEHELGMPLFERRKGRLHPVPEARYLQQECDAILSRINGVRQNLSRLQALDVGELQIVSMPGPSVFLLPELVARLARDRPDVRVTLISRSSDAVVQLVAAQRYDLGLADAQALDVEQTGLVVARHFRFDGLCAVPRMHPLAERESVGPQDLAGEPLATLYPEHATRRLTENAFADAGLTLQPRFTAQYFLPLLSYVEQGLACAIVDSLSAESYRLYRDRSRIRFLPFLPTIEHRVSLIVPAHRPASRLATAFAALVEAEFVRISAT